MRRSLAWRARPRCRDAQLSRASACAWNAGHGARPCLLASELGCDSHMSPPLCRSSVCYSLSNSRRSAWCLRSRCQSEQSPAMLRHTTSGRLDATAAVWMCSAALVATTTTCTTCPSVLPSKQGPQRRLLGETSRALTWDAQTTAVPPQRARPATRIDLKRKPQ